MSVASYRRRRFHDRARTRDARRVVAAALPLLGSVVAGCGEHRPVLHGESRAVATVYETAIGAMARGDAEAACRLITPEAVERVILDDLEVGSGCAEFVAAVHAELNSRQVNALGSVRVRKVHMTAHGAMILNREREIPQSLVDDWGEVDNGATKLIKVRGRWMIQRF